MELKDLKSAWDTYSSQEMDKHRLGKENIQQMLKTRTKSLVDRIDRNIRIGTGVLLLFIAYALFDDLYLSKILLPDSIKYPGWMIPFDVFSNTLIVTTYLFFVIRYLKIKRSFSVDLQLKDLLSGIQETLKAYRRMFYLAVVILMLNIVASFTAGVYQGLKLKADAVSGGVINLTTNKLFLIIGISLAVIIPMVAFSFLLLRWGFNKLYGKYLQSLGNTLKELDESETTE
jgi:hypothetical protein